MKIQRILAFGLLMVVCSALWPTLALADPPSPKGKVVYEDDFNDSGKKSGLEENKTALDYSRGFHAPGVYHLKSIKPSETHWSMFPRQSYANFTIEIDMYDSSDSFTGDAAEGLIVRATDDTHFYAVFIDPRVGQYAVRKLDGANHWSNLIAPKASKLVKQESDVNHLRVDGEGSQFTIYLNGEALDSFTDSAYTKGGIGLIASNTDAIDPHMHFDNIKVYSDTASAAGAPTTPATLPTTGDSNGSLPLAMAIFALLLLLGGFGLRVWPTRWWRV